MNVTEEQKKSTLDGELLVIKASAGSGKTYTLAQLYIELLLLRPNGHGQLDLRDTHDYHQHILAITFTNKATDEMKRRIVRELHQLATDAPKSKYYAHFQALCTSKALAGLQQAAKEALTALLMNYSQMNVCTIDSFFQSILRNFARELDRDYNYEVQIDTEYALRTAVHSFLTSLGRKADDTGAKNIIENWVREFIRSNVEQDKNWNFFNNDELVEFSKNLSKELFQSHMGEIRKYLTTNEHDKVVGDMSRIRQFRNELIKARDQYKKDYLAACDELNAIIQRHGIEQDHLNKKRSLYPFVFNGKNIPSDALRGITEATISKQFLKDYPPTEQAAADIVASLDKLIIAYDSWKLFAGMVTDVGLLGLLGEIDLKLEEYRKDNNVVLIADANDLIHQLVANGKDSVPFVYERVGTWINHFMIDEFQDTSRKQYDDFVPLLDESLARESDNFNLVIGDAKQSIYRFRNADPSLFRDGINEQYNGRIRLSGLDTNYRSSQHVVKFNNFLFEQLVKYYVNESDQPIAANEVQSTYGPTTDYQQKCPEDHSGGYVRVLTKTSDDKPYKEASVLAELPDYLLDLHKRWCWGKIGILVSTNKEASSVIQAILKHNKSHVNQPELHINVTSDEAMQLQNSPSVRRIVSMLRFVDLVLFKEAENNGESVDDTEAIPAAASTPHHDRATAAAHNRLSEQRLLHVLGDFVAALSEQGECDDTKAGRILDDCFTHHDANAGNSVEDKKRNYAKELARMLPDPHTQPLTLTSIVEQIIERISTTDAAHKHETAFLLAFQSCVVDFASRTSGGTVREFLRYWDQRKNNLTVPSTSGEDAITVMTIHKAKGLEFGCVIIPFANWEMNDSSQEHLYWMPKEDWTNQNGNNLLAGVPQAHLTDDLLPPLLPIRKTPARNLASKRNALIRFLDEKRAETLIDNLNKTYVAFTRPQQELHVFAFADKPKASATERVGQLLAALIPKITVLSDWQGRGWQLGEPAEPKTDIEDDTDINTAVMPPYYVTPSPGKVTVKLPRDVTDRQSQGTQLHGLMEHVRYRRDVTKALNQAERRGVFNGTQWTRQQFETLLNELFTNADTAAWWDDNNQVYNERSLVNPTDGATCQPDEKKPAQKVIRPDRVVRRPDGSFIVVDYKFGMGQYMQNKDKREEQIDKVQQYMRLLADITQASVQGYLLYLAPGKPPKVVGCQWELGMRN